MYKNSYPPLVTWNCLSLEQCAVSFLHAFAQALSRITVPYFWTQITQLSSDLHQDTWLHREDHASFAYAPGTPRGDLCPRNCSWYWWLSNHLPDFSLFHKLFIFLSLLPCTTLSTWLALQSDIICLLLGKCSPFTYFVIYWCIGIYFYCLSVLYFLKIFLAFCWID